MHTFSSVTANFGQKDQKEPPMKLKNLVAAAFMGLILSGFGSTLMLGKAEYTKTEKKPCTACHVKAGSKELNDLGKCYAKNHSLKDCQEKPSEAPTK